MSLKICPAFQAPFIFRVRACPEVGLYRVLCDSEKDLNHPDSILHIYNFIFASFLDCCNSVKRVSHAK